MPSRVFLPRRGQLAIARRSSDRARRPRRAVGAIAEAHSINYYDVPLIHQTVEPHSLQSGRYIDLGLRGKKESESV